MDVRSAGLGAAAASQQIGGYADRTVAGPRTVPILDQRIGRLEQQLLEMSNSIDGIHNRVVSAPPPANAGQKGLGGTYASRLDVMSDFIEGMRQRLSEIAEHV